ERLEALLGHGQQVDDALLVKVVHLPRVRPGIVDAAVAEHELRDLSHRQRGRAQASLTGERKRLRVPYDHERALLARGVSDAVEDWPVPTSVTSEEGDAIGRDDEFVGRDGAGFESEFTKRLDNRPRRRHLHPLEGENIDAAVTDSL